jgi:hypothetical protein
MRWDTMIRLYTVALVGVPVLLCLLGAFVIARML